ncbi:MAG: DUF4129 domain-containing protein [Bacillota bacterium]
MRGRPVLLLLLLLSLLAGTVRAEARPVSLAEYRSRLEAGTRHLEMAGQLLRSDRGDEARMQVALARFHLHSQWVVSTPHGPVQADLTDLERQLSRPPTQRSVETALTLAREHLAAARAFDQVQRVEVPNARERLDRALEQSAARSALQRLSDWFNRLLGRQMERLDGPEVPPEAVYAAGAVAALALLWLGVSLYRSLSAHGAAGDAALQARRERPDRPATPAELREQARRLSARGAHLEAVRTAHLALLKHFDSLQLIRYVPAQTNREHEWQLRRRYPQLGRSFRALNDLVDDRLYSGHGATGEDFMRVEALVEQLWREGDGLSKGAEATTGRSSSASSR